MVVLLQIANRTLSTDGLMGMVPSRVHQSDWFEFWWPQELPGKETKAKEGEKIKSMPNV